MTDVLLARGGGRFAAQAHGHAGTQALCAAVSCLLYTLDGWLHNAPGTEILAERMEPGDARLVWRAEGPENDAAFEMTAIGFLQLQGAEPELLRVRLLGDAEITEGGRICRASTDLSSKRG